MSKQGCHSFGTLNFWYYIIFGPVLVSPPVIWNIIFGLTSILSKYEHKFQIDIKMINIKLKTDN